MAEKTFKAVVKVNSYADIRDLPECQARIMAFVDAKTKQERVFNKDYVVPQSLIEDCTSVTLTIGQELTIGDTLEYVNDNPLSLAIKTYPKSFFDKYNKRLVPMFNQAFGNVSEVFDANLENYDPETKAFILKNKAKHLSRFTPTPVLEVA